jgi:hypothetical protein
MRITDLGASALWTAIRSRQVSCRDVMQAVPARMAALKPVHNAIVSLRDGDVLLREAQVWPFDAARRWPTHTNGVEMDRTPVLSVRPSA